MCGAVRILVKTPETDEVVRPEELDLLTRFFHLDILCRQRVDPKHLSLWVNQTSSVGGKVDVTLESIFISSSVGERMSSHHVCPSTSAPFRRGGFCTSAPFATCDDPFASLCVERATGGVS